MMIIFLCSSLEPGKDGVGDYTRKLAMEIAGRGFATGIIAINDRYCTGNIENKYAFLGGEVSTLRLPSIQSENKRFLVAKEWVKKRNPAWLSLQFVPFGFNKKGLPFGLPRQLLKLGKGTKWHIMFHELWVGMDKQSSFKFKVWGWGQKKIIQTIIQKLKPSVINTQSWLYKRNLQKLGASPILLPLFSNMPVAKTENMRLNKGKTLKLVLFGNIHYGAPVDAFAKEAFEWGRENDKSLLVVFVGRCGSELKSWQTALQNVGVATEVTGESTPEQISGIMQNADFGIITTPFSLFEKSGSYAAMREHGLAVICVSRPWTPQYSNEMPSFSGTFEYKVGQLGVILRSASNSPSSSIFNVGTAADQLLSSLTT